MEYSINIVDLLKIAKRNLKVIIAFAIVFGLIAGAYVLISTHKENDLSAEQKSNLEKQDVTYKKYQEKSLVVKERMKEKLIKAYDVLNNHPIMDMDPDNTSFRLLTFTLEENSDVNRNQTFVAWIDRLNNQQLFGKETKNLKKYRKEYVYVSGNIGEVTISIIDAPEYDYDIVAKKLRRYLLLQAKEKDVPIASSENTKNTGFNQGVVDRQLTISNNVTRITNDLTAWNNYKMDQPKGAEKDNAKGVLKKILMVLAGMIFGALLGMLLVSFHVIRKGIVLSAEQIEEIYGIERIASGRMDDSKYPGVIDAVVNALDNTGKAIMIASVHDRACYDDLTKKIDDNSNRRYIYSKASDEDIDVINKLSEIESIVVPVEIGVTTQKDIYETIKWVQKFKKELLGYIVCEG